MTPDLPEELLTSLRARLIARAAEARDEIDRFVDHPDAHVAQTVHQSAHKLAGIASTLGYPDLGDAAAAVDKGQLSCPPDEPELLRLARLRTALCRVVDPTA